MNKQNKLIETGSYQKERGGGEQDEEVKQGQLYGDRRLDFEWWAQYTHHNIQVMHYSIVLLKLI